MQDRAHYNIISSVFQADDDILSAFSPTQRAMTSLEVAYSALAGADMTDRHEAVKLIRSSTCLDGDLVRAS